MIRTVALVGHAGSGKTTLTEALLYKTGAKERRGRVEEGTTTTDYTPEAKLHRTTVRTGVAPLRFRGHRVFLLDAPGSGDFVGEIRGALEAADAALVAVSAEAGVQVGTERAWTVAERLGLPLAMLAKRRLGPRETSVTYVIGDVEGKRPILVDDIVSTGGTIRRGVEALLQAGALPEVVVMATHAVLVGGAKENLAHPAVREVVFTDTIPLKDGGYTVLSTAELLAQAIRHVHTNQSVSALI